ncbi:MAG: cell division protein FtsK [Candidatus Ryanbacteria bacterium CG10_big_fil_rev_8_21_14_0_10_43_42]|uniref:Cell division protein FtsK n=1 Tax=Candidatus Ryanbacteria bacterium CG10_big_fil_rev_8_21_14_0_10_43_42 TaxID=1974864 RepID=A0A2M8KWS2_9BACT|nr:MAG: cell division protein FtsK [Candidatus Ryanbacteria bacterium CG10_big_fil_rev_8_21_14_0_10_43_42]
MDMAKTKNGKKKSRKESEEEFEEDRRRWHDDLRPDTKKSVWAVLSFSVMGLLTLAWFGKAGAIGSVIFSVLTLLFGKAFFLVPLAFFFVGLSLVLGMRERIFAGTFFGGFLFLVSMLGIVDILIEPRTAGYVGFGIAYFPLQLFDVVASVLIFGTFLIISFLLMFNFSFIPRAKEAIEDMMDGNEEDTAGTTIDEKEKQGMFAHIKTMVGMKNEGEERGAEEENENNFSAEEDKNSMESVTEPSTNDAPLEGKRMVSSRNVPSTYVPPPLSILEGDRGKPSSGDIRANANIIQRTLQNFGIDVDMGEISVGPSITQYTLKPAEGVKLSRITNLASNLGLALAAHPLRIEAPIPGRALVGIEVPNKSIAFVGLKNLLTEFKERKAESVLGFALGRDVTGQPVFVDLARAPHMLVAGSTGSGKSVSIHALILGLLFTKPPEQLRFLMIDPKRVELSYYNGIPHLITPVVVEAKKAIQALKWAVKEMERRYEQLQAAGARDIISYNNDDTNEDMMPYLVIVVDELADLMTSYPREVEASIVRIAQMARAVGIHLVVSTQRPSVEVITGLIKANITTRMALQVASQIDSRTILDMAGAEKLLGKGDMLYLSGDTSKPGRVQGVFVSEQEVKRATAYLKNIKEESDKDFEEDIFTVEQGSGLGRENGEEDDELYEDARILVIESGKASTSFLQRRLRLGYARAARLVDMLEERGVVGPGDGAKPRDVLVRRDEDDGFGRDEKDAVSEDE